MERDLNKKIETLKDSNILERIRQRILALRNDLNLRKNYSAAKSDLKVLNSAFAKIMTQSSSDGTLPETEIYELLQQLDQFEQTYPHN
jgi:hypothetical protein